MPVVKNFPAPRGKPHLKGLTRKQQIFVQEIGKGKNPTKAAAIAYNTNHPNTQAADNLAKAYIREAIVAELEMAGVTKAKIASVINQGLDAKKIHTSPTGPDKEVPDWQARHRFVDTAAKLFDLYPDKKIKVDRRSANIEAFVEYTPKQLERLYERQLEEIEKLKTS